MMLCMALKQTFSRATAHKGRGHITRSSISRVMPNSDDRGSATAAIPENMMATAIRPGRMMVPKSAPAAAASAKERGRRIDRLKAACQRTVVEDVQPALATVIAAAGGEEGDWSLRLDADDPDRQTLLFAYPARMPASARAYLRPVVRLELGARSDHWPSAQAPITPYVAQAFPAAFRAPAVAVKVLAVTRTFREKATLLHAEYHRSPAKPMPPRLSRHYYDLARLIVAGVGEQAVADLELLQRVVDHKTVFFSSGWARYAEARRGSLRLMPASERTPALGADYDSMREMFFGEHLAFPEVLRILEEWEGRFNRGA